MAPDLNRDYVTQGKKQMYQRDIPKLPESISRYDFVELAFDLGRIHMHGYDTIVAAVQIGDYFVSFSGKRKSYRPLSALDKLKYRVRKGELTEKCNTLSFSGEIELEQDIRAGQYPMEILDTPVPQIYSVELAHVVTVISAKINEEFDHGYNSIRSALFDTENAYVRKMEYEILIMLGFHFKVYNFVTVIGLLLADNHAPRLGPVFWDISKEICHNKELLAKDPRLIVISIIILGRRGKLSALKAHRERMFRERIATLAYELELPVSHVISAYIKSH